jgi:hypothetical protein
MSLIQKPSRLAPDMELGTNRTHRTTTAWHSTRGNRGERAAGERGREPDFRIVKNRKFLPKAPGTDSRRSEKWLVVTINRSFAALSRFEMT